MARVLLIVGGGIAAYKSLELVRLLKKAGHEVTPVLTSGGAHFVTEMSLGTLAESRVYTSLWELKDEVEIGHIQLSRAADVLLVCPATADLLAKMAAGIADDLATTLLLATDKPILLAPAMNPHMWNNPATKRNVAQVTADGAHLVGPNIGEMAESGEAGTGRMAEPIEIADCSNSILAACFANGEAILSILRSAAPAPSSHSQAALTALRHRRPSGTNRAKAAEPLE